jgi:hypothetical protein
MGIRRRAFLIFSMLVLQNCTCYVKRRSWLGPESLLQVQAMPNGRDSYGFASAGGKIYLFAGLVNDLGMHVHASSSHSQIYGFFVQFFPGIHYVITLLYADNSLQLFDPETNTWIELSQMTTGIVPPAMGGHRIVSLGKSIYSFGGQSEQGNQPPASLTHRKTAQNHPSEQRLHGSVFQTNLNPIPIQPICPGPGAGSPVCMSGCPN